MGWFVFPNFLELAAFRETKIPRQEPVSEALLGWCISVQAVDLWVFSHQQVRWRLKIKCGGAVNSQPEFLLASGGLSMNFVACGVGYV